MTEAQYYINKAAEQLCKEFIAMGDTYSSDMVKILALRANSIAQKDEEEDFVQRYHNEIAYSEEDNGTAARV